MKKILLSLLIITTQIAYAAQFDPIQDTTLAYDGSGCMYTDSSKKASNDTLLIATDANYKGLLVNLNGKDVVFSSVPNKDGLYKQQGYTLKITKIHDMKCGEECSKSLVKAVVEKNKEIILSSNLIELCGG